MSVDQKYREFRQSVDIKRVPKYESKLTSKKVFRDVASSLSAYGKANHIDRGFKQIINGDEGNRAEAYFELKNTDHMTLVSVFFSYYF